MPASDSSKWPHAVQFCYILYDNQTNTAKIINEVIRLPEGVEMSAQSEAVHKISLAKSQGQTKRVVNPKTGEELLTYNPEIHEVLREFMSDFQKADVIVAHNLRFDRNMLLAEMDRLRKRTDPGFEIFKEYIYNLYANKKEFCTGLFGADVCKITATNKAGKEYYKMPKLNALYDHLFGYFPDETKLHDALMDVVICMRCFYKIRYDVDLCQTSLDPKIAMYIDEMSPETYKCGVYETESEAEERLIEDMVKAEAFANVFKTRGSMPGDAAGPGMPIPEPNPALPKTRSAVKIMNPLLELEKAVSEAKSAAKKANDSAIEAKSAAIEADDAAKEAENAVPVETVKNESLGRRSSSIHDVPMDIVSRFVNSQVLNDDYVSTSSVSPPGLEERNSPGLNRTQCEPSSVSPPRLEKRNSPTTEELLLSLEQSEMNNLDGGGGGGGSKKKQPKGKQTKKRKGKKTKRKSKGKHAKSKKIRNK